MYTLKRVCLLQLCMALGATVSMQFAHAEDNSIAEFNARMAAEIKAVDAKIAQHPKDAKLYAERGKLNKRDAKYAIALKDFDEAIKLDPSDGMNYFYEMQLNMLLKNSKAALAAANQAVSHGVKNGALFSNRADLRMEFHDEDGALQDLTKSLELDPDCSPELRKRGYLYFGKDQVELGLKDLDRVSQLEPDDLELKENLKGAHANFEAEKKKAAKSKP